MDLIELILFDCVFWGFYETLSKKMLKYTLNVELKTYNDIELGINVD